MSALKDPRDIKSDGNGAWEHGTYPSTHILITDYGIVSSRARPTDGKLSTLGELLCNNNTAIIINNELTIIIHNNKCSNN